MEHAGVGLPDHRADRCRAAVPATLATSVPLAAWRTLPPQREVSGHRLPPHGSAAARRCPPSVPPSGDCIRCSGARQRKDAARRGDPRSDRRGGPVRGDDGRHRGAGGLHGTRGGEDPHAGPTWRRRSMRSPPNSNSGVRQYNEMVTAAAHVVSSANAGAPVVEQRYRHELVDATDRLLGWAQAFEELGTARRV